MVRKLRWRLCGLAADSYLVTMYYRGLAVLIFLPFFSLLFFKCGWAVLMVLDNNFILTGKFLRFWIGRYMYVAVRCPHYCMGTYG